MASCEWLMPRGTGCRRTGTGRFGDLRFCHQHLDELLLNMHWAIQGEGDMPNRVRAAAREALDEIDAERQRAREASAQVRQHERQLVYFVERDGFCKIGYSTNLTKRLKDISKGSCLIEGMTVGPVRLLATIGGGDLDTEKWHHRRFAHLRVGGEWFLLDDELGNYIGGLKGCVAPELKAVS